MTRALALSTLALAALAACGDDRQQDEVVTAIGGTRLAPTWYGFDDGARQLAPEELYDRAEHTACTPRVWADGVLRCVPIAEEAVYTDETCTEAVGLALTIMRPSHFLSHEVIDGASVPAHLYRAGPVTTRIASYHERRGGACVGPFVVDSAFTIHALAGEIDGATLPALVEEELGGGRLALVVFTSDDGLRLPTGLRDRALGVRCRPALDADGRVTCRPASAQHTSVYADEACRTPAVSVGVGRPVPELAELTDADGCPRYFRVGGAIGGPLYRREGDECHAVAVNPGAQAFDASEPFEPPALERTVLAEPDRRLQRIILAGDGLRFVDDRLYDGAIDEDCVPGGTGGELRCIPETLANATTLFLSSRCQLPAQVALMPQPGCRRPRFARGVPEAPPGELHAIGDPILEPLYQQLPGACFGFTPPAGSLVHALGPAIDPERFVGAVRFGER